MPVFIPRFLLAIAYLVALTVVGTVGYMAIDGWLWREALYTTVITVTAVGFQEVRALSEPGRDFTMILLAGGVTGIGVWFTLITSFIVEFNLTDHSFLPRYRDQVGRSGAAFRASRRRAGLTVGGPIAHQRAHPSGNGTDRDRGAETDQRDA